MLQSAEKCPFFVVYLVNMCSLFWVVSYHSYMKTVKLFKRVLHLTFSLYSRKMPFLFGAMPLEWRSFLQLLLLLCSLLWFKGHDNHVLLYTNSTTNYLLSPEGPLIIMIDSWFVWAIPRSAHCGHHSMAGWERPHLELHVERYCWSVVQQLQVVSYSLHYSRQMLSR